MAGMFDLRSFLPGRRRGTVPQWAQFLALPEYENFVSLIQQTFPQADRAQIEAGEILSGPNRFGLSNVAQLCHASAPTEWSTIVRAHVAALEQGDIDAEITLLCADNFSARSQLRLQFYPGDFADAAKEAAKDGVVRNDIPSIISMLVIDRPTNLISVKRKHIAHWGISDEELFAIAMDNLRGHVFPTVTDVDDLGLKLASSDDLLSTTHVLRLNEFPDSIGRGGCLVGLPTRHVFIYKSIEDPGIVTSMSTMAELIMRFNLDGPGSLSKYLYWWNEGVFTNVPYGLNDGKLAMRPPDEFLAMLNRLPALAL